MRPRWISALLGGTALAAFAARSWLVGGPAVVVAPVVVGTAVEAIHAAGRVEPATRLEIRARASGAVADLPVRAGDRVRRGDLLARIEAPTIGFDAQRAGAELHLARARRGTAAELRVRAARTAELSARLAWSRSQCARASALEQAGALAAAERERSCSTETALAAAIVASAREERGARLALTTDAARAGAAFASSETRVDDLAARAPEDGLVLARYVEPGEIVAAGQKLVRIGRADVLGVHVLVDQADIGRVHPGMAGVARLPGFPGEVFAVRVEHVAPDGDRARRAFRAELRFESAPPALRIGMTVEANLVIHERPAVRLVPTRALVGDDVWWLDRTGRVRRRSLRLGLRGTAYTEVISGLGAGERVVLEPDEAITEGVRVRARAADAGEIATERP